MMTSMTRPCFTTHQTCKTKTKIIVCKTKTKTDFLVSDRSCPKTDRLRPHLWTCRQVSTEDATRNIFTKFEVLSFGLTVPNWTRRRIDGRTDPPPLSVLTAIFPGEAGLSGKPRLASFIESKDYGSGADNWSHSFIHSFIH